MVRTVIRLGAIVIATLPLSTLTLAKLPPQSPEAVATAAETAARTAWNDKVQLYKLCLAQDRVAAGYRNQVKAAGKPIPNPTTTPSCLDPGPYVAQITPETSKPSEASGAHSPAGTAVSPPSTNTPAAKSAKSAEK